jgi:hypothetical protein
MKTLLLNWKGGSASKLQLQILRSIPCFIEFSWESKQRDFFWENAILQQNNTRTRNFFFKGNMLA